MVRKGLILAAILSLATGLTTSCAKKKKDLLLADYGFGYCDGTIGSFDLYLIKSKTQPGMYELSFVVAKADQPGDVASIYIANRSLEYKTMVQEVVLADEREIFAGYMTEEDLNIYDIAAVVPYGNGTSFLTGSPEKEALCQIPLLGDGVDEY